MSNQTKWEETTSKSKNNRDIWATIYMAYRPYLGRVIFIILIGLLARLLILGNTNIIGMWVDKICTEQTLVGCSNKDSNFLINFSSQEIIVLLLIQTLIGFLLTMAFRILFSRWSANAVSLLYDETTLRTSRFPMSFFDKTPAGRIITRFSSDYGNVFRLFGGPLAEFLSIIFDLIAIVILLILSQRPFVMIVLGGFLMYSLTYFWHKKKLYQYRRELSASRSPSISHFAETTQGALVIRIFNKNSIFMKRFEKLNDFYLDKKVQATKKIIQFSLHMNFISALLLLLTGLYFTQIQAVSVGSLGVAFSFIVMSSSSIAMFFDWLSQFEDAFIGVDRMNEYLRGQLEKGNALPHHSLFHTDHAFKSQAQVLSDQSLIQKDAASVEFRELYLKYSDNSEWILKNIHLKIAPGEVLGIVGRTGSGKSTLIQALFQLYPYQRGEILIDGSSPWSQTNRISLDQYRKHIAYIAQDSILFQGSLWDNLDFLRLASEEQVLKSLEQVRLKEWVLQHPQKLLLPIEERGKNLSLGERQLICMARCLLQETPIVVMDEATSSVDPQSEEIMVKATQSFFKGKTQIIIAHRISTLEKCDRILWLDHGQVKMLGPTLQVLPEFIKQSGNMQEFV